MKALNDMSAELAARDAAVIVIGPEGPQEFADYWAKYNMPFVGLPDPSHSVLKMFGQQVKIFKFGRMPGQILVDKSGIVRFVHYGKDMTDIPSVDEMIDLLDNLQNEVD